LFRRGGVPYWLMEKPRFLIQASDLSDLGFSQEPLATLCKRNRQYAHIGTLEARNNSQPPEEFSAAFFPSPPLRRRVWAFKSRHRLPCGRG
jgi:hypothetical protein